MQGLSGAQVRTNLRRSRDNAPPPAGEADPPTETGKSGMANDVLFGRVQTRLKAQVGPDVFSSWFGRLKLESISKSIVRLSVPTTFLRSWINNRYLDLLTQLFAEENSEINKVEIVVRSATRGNRLIQSSEISDVQQSTGPGSQSARPAAVPHPGAKSKKAQMRPVETGSVSGSPLDARYAWKVI